MTILIVIPTWKEYFCFLHACEDMGVDLIDVLIGRMACKQSAERGLTVACGGLGKVLFGVSTQHLIDCGSPWDLVICAGAGGGLSQAVSVGDIVVGCETVEHDFKNHFGQSGLPRFPASHQILKQYRVHATLYQWPFGIQFGAIASGDQDVADEQVAADIVARTQAIAVAWEGAGGARACQFSDVPFVEIRGISDAANSSAPSDFRDNRALVMSNLAKFILGNYSAILRVKEIK